MVSQKRRRFLIRQKQKRRIRKFKANSSYELVNETENALINLLRRIGERKEPPTMQEIDFIKQKIKEAKAQQKVFFSQSISDEKRTSQPRIYAGSNRMSRNASMRNHVLTKLGIIQSELFLISYKYKITEFKGLY